MAWSHWVRFPTFSAQKFQFRTMNEGMIKRLIACRRTLHNDVASVWCFGLILYHGADIEIYIYLVNIAGNYMYIEASSPRKPGEKAKLALTVPNSGNQSCLSFYYHMYGASAGTLNVYSGNIKVFTATGNQGDNWLIMEMNLYLNGVVSKTCLPDIHVLTLAGSCQSRKCKLCL